MLGDDSGAGIERDGVSRSSYVVDTLSAGVDLATLLRGSATISAIKTGFAAVPTVDTGVTAEVHRTVAAVLGGSKLYDWLTTVPEPGTVRLDSSVLLSPILGPLTNYWALLVRSVGESRVVGWCLTPVSWVRNSHVLGLLARLHEGPRAPSDESAPRETDENE